MQEDWGYCFMLISGRRVILVIAKCRQDFRTHHNLGGRTDRKAETEIRTMHAQYVLSVGIYRYMFVALPVPHGPNQ